jgi:drug/metabolite transporter (DMT)-like permease
MTFVFWSVQLLPLAEAQTLAFTGPFWATLLAMVMLKEKIGKWRWSALALGFIGILVITQPGQSHIPLLGVVVGLIAPMLVALLSIMIKDLNRTERPLAIVFWFSVLSAPMMALFLPFFMTAHDATGWALLTALGLSGAIGQILLTLALRYGAVSAVIVMDYTGLIWVTIYGWLVWDQLPTTATWFGAPLIVAAGLIIAWREHSLARTRAALSVAP